MAFSNLSSREQLALREAIIAVLISPDLHPDDCSIRYGVSFHRIKHVLRKWPEFDEEEETLSAINGCLNEVCHGIAFDDDPDMVGMTPKEWPKWFSVSKDEMMDIFHKWRNLAR
ncbi:MAG TPA: hypothetical protein VJ739_02210 [Gemmataceae bacterium]|nr:hypothetical protein [Gemmataceae bacterium]